MKTDEIITRQYIIGVCNTLCNLDLYTINTCNSLQCYWMSNV